VSVFVKARFSGTLLFGVQLLHSLFQLSLKPRNNLPTSTPHLQGGQNKVNPIFFTVTLNTAQSNGFAGILYVQFITHTRLTALYPGLPGWAGTRKVKPIWILLKQETVSGSGNSWAICKSAPRSRQITMPPTCQHLTTQFIKNIE